MTAVEVVLIIIGFACLCASVLLAKKSEKEATEADGSAENGASVVWTEKEENMIRSRITEILEERQIELVDTTEDQMNRICNEKIMAIDEFSNQLLEKIENNHQEVVFMYNMLNEKQKEIKKVIAEPVATKKTEVMKQNPVAKKEAPKKEVAKKEVQKKQVATSSKEEKPTVNVPGNVNLQIQKMHKEGKSVLEISKALDIGQGEVKLVIALYGGKGR